jgi:kinase
MEPHLTEDKPVRIDQESSSSSNRDAEASTSTSMKPVKTEEAGADLLPKEMNIMTISDDKADGHNDKVISISLIH